MKNKEKYRRFCNKEKTIPIFSKDWWMDAVCGENNWDVLLIEKGGQIVASLPYFLRKRGKRRYITQPPLTKTNGIWIKYPPNQKYCKKLTYEKKVMTEIINQLDKLNLDYYNQNFHYSITNWLPFYWKGFKQTTRYTYVIEDLENLDKVFRSFSHSKRKNIRKAKNITKIKTDLPAKDFYENHMLTLEKQNDKISYSFNIFENIYNSVYSHNSGKIFYAIDDRNNIHAALLIIWDDIQAHDLISTIDPDFRNSGAASLVVKESIKYISKRTKKFDFEGSMIEGVENSFRKFGAIQKPYFNISKNYKKENIFKIIVKDVYYNYPILQKAYHKIKGR